MEEGKEKRTAEEGGEDVGNSELKSGPIGSQGGGADESALVAEVSRLKTQLRTLKQSLKDDAARQATELQAARDGEDRSKRALRGA